MRTEALQMRGPGVFGLMAVEAQNLEITRITMSEKPEANILSGHVVLSAMFIATAANMIKREKDRFCFTTTYT